MAAKAPAATAKEKKTRKRMPAEIRLAKVDYYKFTCNYSISQIAKLLHISHHTAQKDVQRIKDDTRSFWVEQATTGFSRYIQTTVTKMNDEIEVLESMLKGLAYKSERTDPQTGKTYWVYEAENINEYGYLKTTLDHSRQLRSKFLTEHGLLNEMARMFDEQEKQKALVDAAGTKR